MIGKWTEKFAELTYEHIFLKDNQQPQLEDKLNCRIYKRHQQHMPHQLVGWQYKYNVLVKLFGASWGLETVCRKNHK
ncbi:unnamed protein product [Arabidopsis halleri]